MQIKEIRDIVISSLVLAFVFSYTGISGFSNINVFAVSFGLSILFVSLGFILHELSHRYFARKYGCKAEFQMWPIGLAIAVILIVLTDGNFTFAAPGAVMIYPMADLWGNKQMITKKQNGIISVAGPLTNAVLALIFLLLAVVTKNSIFLIGTTVNAFLGFFNMLPIPPLDGFKVLRWDKRIWVAAIAACVLILFATGFV